MCSRLITWKYCADTTWRFSESRGRDDPPNSQPAALDEGFASDCLHFRHARLHIV
jgi:hypothetical protein